MTGAITRRRAAILLGAGGAGLLCGGQAAPVTLYRWQATSLGSPVRLLLYHSDRRAAAAVIARCRDEIERLERCFALYRADSEIATLNRTGRLAAPSQDFRLVLAQALRLSRVSEGAFDPTVQPLWDLYARHFFAPASPPAEGPPARDIEAARALVDWRSIAVTEDAITLARPGMGLTLNGIAQGYVVDRVTEVLREHGCTRLLADMGKSEIAARGRHADGRAWHVGIVDPRAQERFARTLDLADCALCTSGGYGTKFEPTGRHHHLFDPQRGTSASHFIAVSVLAPSAMVADGLSTMLYVAPPERSADLVAAFPGVRALLTRADGSIADLSAQVIGKTRKEV
jgi:FAD:protein FMN transferase